MKTKTHKYRITICGMYVKSYTIKRKKFVALETVPTTRGARVFTSSMPKWATTDEDQRIREACDNTFALSWSQIKFKAV